MGYVTRDIYANSCGVAVSPQTPEPAKLTALRKALAGRTNAAGEALKGYKRSVAMLRELIAELEAIMARPAVAAARLDTPTTTEHSNPA